MRLKGSKTLIVLRVMYVNHRAGLVLIMEDEAENGYTEVKNLIGRVTSFHCSAGGV
jgi:hypothetical protein